MDVLHTSTLEHENGVRYWKNLSIDAKSIITSSLPEYLYHVFQIPDRYGIYSNKLFLFDHTFTITIGYRTGLKKLNIFL
jgi:hypothetical protein